ncbi:MAG: hypothetical protein ACP5OA_03395 [Candidatus Woesearchaeota archaeon]
MKDYLESEETMNELKVRPVKTYHCHTCGCAYDTLEEAICCPCIDDLPDYEDVESHVYGDRLHKRIQR